MQLERLIKSLKNDTGIIFTENNVLVNGDFEDLSDILVTAMRADPRLVDLFSDALSEVVTTQ